MSFWFTMKNLLIIVFAAFVSFFHVQAQSTVLDMPETWHLGELQLIDDSVIEGEFRYDLLTETIQLLNENNKVQTFTTQQVFSLTLYDQEVNGIRNILVLPYINESGYERPKLFEVIVEGKATLLARGYFVKWGDPQHPMTLSKHAYIFDGMFIMNEDGEINKILLQRANVANQFGDQQAKLKKFMKKERLKLDDLPDVTKLFEYYNNELH